MPLIRLKAFAEDVGRKEETVRKWLRNGAGPVPVRINGQILFDADEARAWIEAQRDERDDDGGRAA